MIWIQKIHYGPHGGGAQAGKMMVHLKFSGLSPMGSEEVAETARIVRNVKTGPAKIAWLEGDFDSENDSPLLSLTKALSDQGWQIGASVTGATWFTWFAFVDWLQVFITDQDWPGFACKEFIYLMDDLEKEPTMPPISKELHLYLWPSKKVSKEDLFGYIQNSQYPWGIYTPTELTGEVIYREGEENGSK